MNKEYEIEAAQLSHIAKQATAAVGGRRAIVFVVYEDRASIGTSGYTGKDEQEVAATMCWDMFQALQASMPGDAKITIENSKGDSWELGNQPQVFVKHIWPDGSCND